MDAKEIETWKILIDEKSQVELARLWRFAPSGHPVFSIPELSEYFNTKFKGFTPRISKLIGWGENQ